MRSLKSVRHQQAKALVKLPHRGNLGHSGVGVGDRNGRCSAWIPLGPEFFGSVVEAIDELDTAIGTRESYPVSRSTFSPSVRSLGYRDALIPRKPHTRR